MCPPVEIELTDLPKLCPPTPFPSLAIALGMYLAKLAGFVNGVPTRNRFLKRLNCLTILQPENLEVEMQ